MSSPEINYESLVHDAMRGVVRGVLQRVVRSGLPGEHHFFISFGTRAPGVVLSKRLREKYASEMTIVLQHRFTNLQVNDDRFEVTLSFDGIPERLSIPFPAIRVFFDPSVPFGHQFEPSEADAASGAHGETVTGREPALGQPAAGPQPLPAPNRKPTRPTSVPAAGASDAAPAPGQSDREVSPPSPAKAGGEPARAPAKVVALDAFRKK